MTIVPLETICQGHNANFTLIVQNQPFNFVLQYFLARCAKMHIDLIGGFTNLLLKAVLGGVGVAVSLLWSLFSIIHLSFLLII